MSLLTTRYLSHSSLTSDIPHQVPHNFNKALGMTQVTHNNKNYKDNQAMKKEMIKKLPPSK